jgi:hypothetical protein
VNFIYSAQVLSAFQRTITNGRLTHYLASTGGDIEAAVKLYVANTRLCEAFYTPLQGIEISLRNAMNGEMVARYGLNWLEQRKAPLLQNHRHKVEEAIGKLTDDGKPIVNGGLVAELNFGFWVGILGPKYENALWRPTLRKAFPSRPKGMERQDIQGALNAIRRLRNRVMHHERILQRNLVEDHELILRLIGWICPETRAWVAAHSTFDPALLP